MGCNNSKNTAVQESTAKDVKEQQQQDDDTAVPADERVAVGDAVATEEERAEGQQAVKNAVSVDAREVTSNAQDGSDTAGNGDEAVTPAVVDVQAIEDSQQQRVSKLCDTLLENVAAAEPQVTKTLEDLCKGFTDTRLSGLKHKFKSKNSLFRKAMNYVEEAQREIMSSAGKRDSDTPEVHVERQVLSITDALRYTIVSPHESYTKTVKGIVDKLKETGMAPLKSKNFWAKGDHYQGINTVWETSHGGHTIHFELQFHTPESLKTKKVCHQYYEKFRVERDPRKKRHYFEQGTAEASQVPVPADVLDIPEEVLMTPPDVAQVVAENILNSIVFSESNITEDIERVCEKTGGGLADKNIQTVAHLQFLVERYEKNNPSDDIVEAENEVYDGLQYCIVFADDQYVSGVRDFCSQLRDRRYAVAALLNYWKEGDAYQGIHARVHGMDESLCGFEVQFHTPASFKVKYTTSQDLLRKFMASEDSSERRKLFKNLVEMWDNVKAPEGVLELEGSKVVEFGFKALEEHEEITEATTPSAPADDGEDE